MKAKTLPFCALTALLLFISLFTQAQVQTARYVSMNPSTNGYYEYLPQGYNPSGTERYPLLLFVHGLGEVGAGNSSTMPALLRNAIPKIINEGRFPVSFTVNGQTSKFIVISPQFNKWPTFTDVDQVLDYIEAHYKVDATRIYVTGLSMGGGVTWEYGGCSSNLKYVQRIAGIVPICGASTASIYRARTIAKYNLPVWAFHNSGDPTAPVAYTNDYIDMINQAPAPNPMAKKTIFNASGHDAWTRAYDPAYKENNMNVYEWMLQYNRSVTQPPANTAPTANAGADKTITLPTNSVAVTGSGADANGSIASYAWTRISGPTQFTISNAAISNPTFSNLVAGVYVFRLTVTDNQGATGYDEVRVTVNAAANTAPTANAGTDKTITLPTSSVSLTGSGTDANGTIASYAWTRTSGPTQFTISNAAVSNPTLSNLVAGVYIFRLTVTDNQGATGGDDIRITVNAAANTAPVANAGTDKTITLPTSSVSLTGSGTDANGTIASYAWTRTSGPTQFTISNAAASNPTLSNLVAGVYIFRLTVTDNQGATGGDDIRITVNAAANTAPVANAGTDKTITLPTSSVSLTGSGTDANGTIASYAWTRTSGPTQFTISNAAVSNPTLSNLVAGVYIFRLTVTDNQGATAGDDIRINVNATANTAPVANAGADKTITLPVNSVSLAGSGTDVNGTIAGFSWTRTAGPTQYTISSTTISNPQLSNLVAGTYTFRLTVRDDLGATGIDDINIIVLPQEPLGDPEATKYIKVNVYGGSNAYTNPEWNNWNMSSASGLLKYSDGTTSAVSATVNIPGSIADNGVTYPGGMAPAEVLRHTNYSTTQRTITISGLNSSKTYDFEFYAGRANNSGNSTIFAISGTSQTVNTFNNSTQKAVITGKKPDANGRIVVTVSRANTYTYINGFMITESQSALTRTEGSSGTATAERSVPETTTEINREILSFYPNPVVSEMILNLDNNKMGAMTVSIIDQSGRILEQRQFNKNLHLFNSRINLSHLRSGIYLIRVQIGDWSGSGKLMKQ